MVIAWVAIVGSIINVLKYSFGLPIRLGTSGDIDNYPELAGIRLLMIIVTIALGLFGVWWLVNCT